MGWTKKIMPGRVNEKKWCKQKSKKKKLTVKQNDFLEDKKEILWWVLRLIKIASEECPPAKKKRNAAIRDLKPK